MDHDSILPLAPDPLPGHVEVRLARPGDFAAIASIEDETIPMFPPSALPEHLAHTQPIPILERGVAEGLLWIAVDARAGPVGFILCRRIDGCLHVEEVDVRPRYGRRGIGTGLLARACGEGRRLGLGFATLTTFESVAWNAPFYARRGFGLLRDASAFPHLVAALRDERVRGFRDRVAMARALLPSL